jgi:hypothetical protein
MTGGYGSHKEYISWVKEDATIRKADIESALRQAFGPFIEEEVVDTIDFDRISIDELAAVLTAHASVLKPLLIVCNVAARAVERDLGIRNLSTYAPRISKQQARDIAAYLKSFLPKTMSVSSLSELDRVQYIDKEVRKAKGRWESEICSALNNFSTVPFKKRLFTAGNERYEIDAASPLRGPVKYAVDVKRIEARRDIHKRSDEIVQKAHKLKLVYPEAKFGAVVYYPFVEEQANVRARLESDHIDYVAFAAQSQESIETAIRLMLSAWHVAS